MCADFLGLETFQRGLTRYLKAKYELYSFNVQRPLKQSNEHDFLKT